MLTLKDYFMGRDVSCAKELTPEITANATELLMRINALLSDLNITNVQISSGWRPPSINANVKGAAKKSAHMTGLACDLKGQDVAIAILKSPDLLKKYSLWLENPSHTSSSSGGWTHLDMVQRSARPLQMFNP